MNSTTGFSVEIEGVLVTDQDQNVVKVSSENKDTAGASWRETITTCETRQRLTLRRYCRSYPGSSVTENWTSVTNHSANDITITRLDSLRLLLEAGSYRHLYYTSEWGKEFSPVEGELAGTKILESTKGRSSRQMHPYSLLRDEAGNVLVLTVAWSGNWIIRHEPLPDGRYALTAGLSNWKFARVLHPGETFEGVHCMMVQTPTAENAWQELARWGKKYWYPSNALSASLPVEWNPWWPYEDAEINETIFKANVDECQKLGVEVCTLDAGWFGPADDELAHWYDYRGDWHSVVAKRFPSGIRNLSDYVHAKGMKFGLWCEIEACGAKAALNQIHPEFVATCDGKPLGYICLGNPQAREWAFSILANLITEYKADWIKLDFNLDPQSGCNRADHGHQAGDGLYEHYRGYYALLRRVREAYPEVLLENCSSGGLRIDLGIMQQCHSAFLSDPDYPVHDLQLFWGATTMLHPSACLHWSMSQTRSGHNGPGSERNPAGDHVPQYRFDYYMRTAMLGRYGFSFRLPEMSENRKERLKYHNDFYKHTVRGFVREGTLFHLTGQALREGGGSRWNAFLYVKDEVREALLFVFRLDKSEPVFQLVLSGLDETMNYRISPVDGGRTFEMSGRELCTQGFQVALDNCESSEIYLLAAA